MVATVPEGSQQARGIVLPWDQWLLGGHRIRQRLRARFARCFAAKASRRASGPTGRAIVTLFTHTVHSHPYHKVLFCVRGSIRFQAGEPPEDCDLRPGDRLDIPPGTPHSAVVGTEGVSCLEAPRRANQ